MTTLQFVRIDLGESPKPGRWTKYVYVRDLVHDEGCEYPACQPADRNETNRQIANED